MLVICYGIAKSGSTLAYELVKGVLESAGHGQERIASVGLKPRGRGNHMESLERDHLIQLIDTIGPDRIIAAKTHQCFDDDMFGWLEDLQAQRKLQVIASYRDPRDICLSLVDHGGRSRDSGRRGFARIRGLSNAMALVGRAIRKFGKWASLEGSLRLYYDTVAFSPDEAIDAIEAALGVTCDHGEAKAHAFDTAFTQKNKAKRNRYDDELDEEQKREMLDAFGPFIERVCRDNDEQWFATFRDEMLAGRA